MSAMRKMGVYLGLLEDAEGEYDEPRAEYDETRRAPAREARASSRGDARTT